jgi:hypothetical protein
MLVRDMQVKASLPSKKQDMLNVLKDSTKSILSKYLVLGHKSVIKE